MVIYERIVKLLEARNIAFRICEHAIEGRCDIVSSIRGNSLCQAMKAMVVMGKFGKKDRKYYLAILPGDRSLDMDALRKHSGASTVLFAPRDRAIALTECEMGAVPPFAFNDELHLIADPSITLNREIVFNAGALDRSIFMGIDDYIKISNPIFVRIAKEAS